MNKVPLNLVDYFNFGNDVVVAKEYTKKYASG